MGAIFGLSALFRESDRTVVKGGSGERDTRFSRASADWCCVTVMAPKLLRGIELETTGMVDQCAAHYSTE